MKIKKPFNGLTSGEHQRLTEIRMLAQVDLVTAKRAAADWVLSNKQRRVLRQAALAYVGSGSRAARGGSHPWLSLSALRYLRLTYTVRYIARQKDEI